MDLYVGIALVVFQADIVFGSMLFDKRHLED